MAYFLYGLFFVSCIVLIASVLLQPGKTDAGALFTSNVSNTNYQPRGAQSVLSKMTIIAATTFMLSALLLSLPALSGNVSVMQTAGEDVPVLGANANTADANANVANDANVATNANVATDANVDAKTDADTKTDAVDETNKAEEKPAAEKPAETNSESN